jgi:hypothetical protein
MVSRSTNWWVVEKRWSTNEFKHVKHQNTIKQWTIVGDQLAELEFGTILYKTS